VLFSSVTEGGWGVGGGGVDLTEDMVFNTNCTLTHIKYKARILDDDLSLFSLYLFSSLIPLRDDKIVKTTNTSLFSSSEAEFSDEIQKKVLRVFLLAIHSHLYGFALRFIFF
jgi:hypothetical protein